MAHKSFSSLKKSVLKKAKEGMDKKVLPIVEHKMIQSIKDVVYSVYPDPVEYVRRKEHGGLIDGNNIIGFVLRQNGVGFDYHIENITRPDNAGYSATDYLAPLIVMGQMKAEGVGYPVLYHQFSELRPYGKPRDFYAETEKRINLDVLASFLEDYMKDIK
jgi:hypothetical protein